MLSFHSGSPLFIFPAYTNNVFYICLIKFFAKRLSHISKRLEQMDWSAVKLVNNRKLAHLIIGYNRVLLDLIEINRFFRYFIGWNSLFYFFFSIMLAFVAISCNDLRLEIALMIMVIIMYFTTILVPYTICNQVPVQVSRSSTASQFAWFK